MRNLSSLASIIAYARAGALDHAWRLFRAAGLDGLEEPAALNVKARLLKDEALRRQGAERAERLREAAGAYRRSAGIRPASYPLVNAATLSLLAGDGDQARALAGEVLERIEREPDEPETPYYRAATGAEALLIRGEADRARLAMAEAIAIAPRAWEDHASTLRQFALIHDALGLEAGWLEALRPPRSLHYAGHMSFDAAPARPRLREEIAALLEGERIGFAFGALAAGADLLIAEAVLEAGAELHVVLPGGAAAFVRASVEPFGGDWKARFDAALARAAAVRIVGPSGAAPDARMLGLADEIAIGMARINAERLASRAVQLLILDPADADRDPAGGTLRARDLWAAGGGDQHVIAVAREAVAVPGPAPAADARLQRLALLCIAPAGGEGEEVSGTLAALAEALQATAPARIGPYFSQEGVLVAFDGAATAAAAARAVTAASAAPGAVRVGGHYGMVETVADPFSGADRLWGDGVALAAAAAASAPPRSICVTGDFAAALAAAGPPGACTDFIGELEPRGGEGAPVELFVVPRPAAS